MSKKTINWSGYEWLTQERFGEIHPKKRFNWYDSSAIEIRDGKLVLKTQYNPKTFTIDGEEFVSPIGIGLVSNTTRFKYGYFEIEAKLPTGKNLWPAFWMWGFDSWPPEIDVFEAYSSPIFKTYLSINFPKIFNFWKIETNFYYNTPDNPKSTGSVKKFLGFKNPQKNFIKYACLWEENKITIFYDGRKIREFTDKQILSQFNNIDMNVIINTSMRDGRRISKEENSEFIINYFKYSTLEEYYSKNKL